MKCTLLSLFTADLKHLSHANISHPNPADVTSTNPWETAVAVLPMALRICRSRYLSQEPFPLRVLRSLFLLYEMKVSPDNH